MMEKKAPRLRTVDKAIPPYKLNSFPTDFGLKLGREVVCLLATKVNASLEGNEWEEIFAKCIGAKWKPSNVGLDDVVLGNCAWGAKTVKKSSPNQRYVRLISGRNSPYYSYGEKSIKEINPNDLGEQVLNIWNERVSAIRKTYKYVRTIVLIKGKGLLDLTVFEFDTIRYDPELYNWVWNERNNLEGFDKKSEMHCFTWQPHGSQFTIIEEIPDNCLEIKIRKPPNLSKESILKSIGFDDSWITVVKK